MDTLGWEAWFVIALTIVFLVLLFLEKASLDVLGLGLIVVLTGAGILDFRDAAAGFANKSVLTIAGLFVIGEGLTRTGAVDFIGRILVRHAEGRPVRLLLWTGATAAVVSAFLNDTAVVAVFIPILIDLARRTRVAVSHLMMPLAFAALLGGTCTLVGTSTNLIVSGIGEELGAPELGMFTMTPIGVPIALVAIVFIALVTRRLLPVRTSVAMLFEHETRNYVMEMTIAEPSPLVGKRYDEAFASSQATIVYYVRGDTLIRPPFGDATAASGDVVLLDGSVKDLARVQGLGLEPRRGPNVDPRRALLFEIAVSPRSTLVGTRVEALGLQRDFGLSVLAVLRDGRHLHESIERRRVRGGDLVLVSGTEDSRERIRASQDFYLLAGEPSPVHLERRARHALVITAFVIVLLASNSVSDIDALPPASVALLGAVAMVSAGCLSARAAYRSIDWSILIFIVGSLALGAAMQRTGVAQVVGGAVVDSLSAFGPGAVVSGMILLCFLFNFLISHSAVAALFTPIAVAAGHRLIALEGLAVGDERADAILRALLLAVCFGGSMCFATPIAHQVNLMVLGPGGYRSLDFLRLGLPVAALVWILASVLIPLVMGL